MLKLIVDLYGNKCLFQPWYMDISLHLILPETLTVDNFSWTMWKEKKIFVKLQIMRRQPAKTTKSGTGGFF